MHYSLMEVLRLTVFSMAVVFLILAGIMGLMMLIARFFGEEEVKEVRPEITKNTEKNLIKKFAKELFAEDPLARAATIIALAEVSEEDGKKFKISDIKRIK